MKMDAQKIKELYDVPIDTSSDEETKDEDYDIREAYDAMTVNPLYSYFNQSDIDRINEIAMSTALNAKPKEKYRLMAEVMHARGFYFIGGGTNRRTYACSYDPRIVAKVATDSVGISNNKREIVNQNVLKPYCCKVYEISPCGTLAIIERVTPVKTQQDFQVIAEEVFDILLFKIRNKNIGMEDIGRRSFKNWGVRNGFGPVLLDYPTMYVIDPERAFCYAKNPVTGALCNAPLDYDDGFDSIVCTACGAKYMSKSLAKTNGDEISELLYSVTEYNKNGRKSTMKFTVKMPWANVVRIYDGEKYITKTVEEYEKENSSYNKDTDDDTIKEDNNISNVNNSSIKVNKNAYYDYLKSIGQLEDDTSIDSNKNKDCHDNTNKPVVVNDKKKDEPKKVKKETTSSYNNSASVINKLNYESVDKFLSLYEKLDILTDISKLGISSSVMNENIEYLLDYNGLSKNNINIPDDCSIVNVVVYDILSIVNCAYNIFTKGYNAYKDQDCFDSVMTNLFVNNKNMYSVFKYISDELSLDGISVQKYKLYLSMIIVMYSEIKSNIVHDIDYKLNNTWDKSSSVIDNLIPIVLNESIVDMKLFENLKKQVEKYHESIIEDNDNKKEVEKEYNNDDESTEEEEVIDFSNVNLESKLYLFVQDGKSTVSSMQVKDLLEILKTNNCLPDVFCNVVESEEETQSSIIDDIIIDNIDSIDDENDVEYDDNESDIHLDEFSSIITSSDSDNDTEDNLIDDTSSVIDISNYTETPEDDDIDYMKKKRYKRIKRNKEYHEKFKPNSDYKYIPDDF